MTVKEANEALDRLFDYCEEIDNHIPEEERTGYAMLPDIQALRKFISTDNTMKWIHKPHIYGVTYCSMCDYENKVDDTKFCPNCGRKAVKK